MRFVPRGAPAVSPGFSPFGRGSLQPSERIETFEFQATVIAKKFMQTGDPQKNQGIVVTALNTRTLTSRAPHTTANLINFVAFEINNLSYCGEIEGNSGVRANETGRGAVARPLGRA